MKYGKRLTEHLATFAKGPARDRALRLALDMKTRDFVEAYGLGAWTNIVADQAHQRAMAQYAAMPLCWDKITHVDPTITDFKAHNILGAGAFGDLDQVDEVEGYPMDTLSDKTAAITVQKYGKIFGISMEARVNDATGLLTRSASELFRAAGRTVEKHVLQTMIRDAPTVTETGLALFHANHSNDVGTSGGYSRAELIAAITLMCNQTGLDGEQLHLMPKYLLVPTSKQFEALEDVNSASKLVVDRDTTATAATFAGVGNELRGFGLEVIPSPYLTTDACYLIADPAVNEGLTIGFLNNQRTPELLVENQESGWAFSHDAIRTKVRHIYGSTWADYRCITRFGV